MVGTTHVEHMTSSVGLPVAEKHAVVPAVLFDRVSFACDDHVVLRDASLSIPKGSILARAAPGSPSCSSSYSARFARTPERFSSMVSRSST